MAKPLSPTAAGPDATARLRPPGCWRPQAVRPPKSRLMGVLRLPRRLSRPKTQDRPLAADRPWGCDDRPRNLKDGLPRTPLPPSRLEAAVGPTVGQSWPLDRLTAGRRRRSGDRPTAGPLVSTSSAFQGIQSQRRRADRVAVRCSESSCRRQRANRTSRSLSADCLESPRRSGQRHPPPGLQQLLGCWTEPHPPRCGLVLTSMRLSADRAVPMANRAFRLRPRRRSESTTIRQSSMRRRVRQRSVAG